MATLAEQARSWARAMPSYPRTVGLLTQISNDWESQAKQIDIRQEQQRLKW